MKTKYRKLKMGETVQVDDIIRHPSGGITVVTHANVFVGHVIHLGTPHEFGRAILPQQDAVTQRMVAATERIRAKTTLGKLESLLADRSRWQRRQTIATTKLSEVQREIDRFASSLAKEKFDAELDSISNQSST